jgi:hypothetical protein
LYLNGTNLGSFVAVSATKPNDFQRKLIHRELSFPAILQPFGL